MNSFFNTALFKGTIPNEVWFNRLELKWPEISERRKKVTKRYKSQTFSGYNNLIQCSLLSDKVSSKKEEKEISKSDEKKLLKFY
jgi:hypothetical protein